MRAGYDKTLLINDKTLLINHDGSQAGCIASLGFFYASLFQVHEFGLDRLAVENAGLVVK